MLLNYETNCDTIVVCGEGLQPVVNISGLFICSVQGQSCTLSYSFTGVSPITIIDISYNRFTALPRELTTLKNLKVINIFGHVPRPLTTIPYLLAEVI